MAFVVQSDTGEAGANSYVSTSYFISFFADRGVDYSATPVEAIKSWLINATEFHDARWSFYGTKLNGRDQTLSFPRANLKDAENLLVEGVPDETKAATCHYARAYSVLNSLFKTESNDKGSIIEEQEKLDVLMTKVKYESGQKASTEKFAIIQSADLVILRSGFTDSGIYTSERA